MMTQTNLFEPADDVEDGSAHVPDVAPVSTQAGQIAVPCGFVDRHGNRCQRLGNWPVTVDGKQLSCRGRPMIHCVPACFRGDPLVKTGGLDDDDIVWEERSGSYGAGETD